MNIITLAEQSKIDESRSMVVMLTVELAAALLKLNTHNRKIKPIVLRRYCVDVERGNWKLTASGIGVSESGKLIDGQHRCEAVVATGVAIPVVIVFGLKDDSQIKVDRHARRSNLDVFSLAGLTHDTVEIQTAVFLAKLSDTGMSQPGSKSGAPSDEDVMAAYHTHKEAIIWASAWSAHEKGFSRIGIVAGLVYYYEAHREKAVAFSARLKDGSGMTRDDPAFRLREWILHGIPGSGSGGSLFQTECFRRCLYASQVDFRGKKSNVLREATTLVFE